jgi:hypothetical protein
MIEMGVKSITIVRAVSYYDTNEVSVFFILYFLGIYNILISMSKVYLFSTCSVT